MVLADLAVCKAVVVVRIAAVRIVEVVGNTVAVRIAVAAGHTVAAVHTDSVHKDSDRIDYFVEAEPEPPRYS